MGADNERISRFGHDRVSTFGIGSDMSKAEWRNIFRQLIASNLLVPNADGHGGLIITNAGRVFLREKPTLFMRHHVKTTQQARSERKRRSSEPLTIDAADQALYDSLKATRTSLAKSRNVPAYVIFGDKTLVDLVQSKPGSLAALAEVYGIGEAKLNNYGEILLDIIAAHGGEV